MLHDVSEAVGTAPVFLGLFLLFVSAFTQRRRRDGGWKMTTAPFRAENGELPTPRYISASLPFVGHILGYVRNGHDYFSSLCLSTPLPVFGLQMGALKVSLIKPVFTRDLPKIRNLGLGPLVLQVFRRSLSMQESSCAILEEQDHLTRQFAPEFSKLLREEFIPNASLRRYIKQIDADIQYDIARAQKQPGGLDKIVDVEDFVFTSLIGALGRSLWGGSRGPFGDAEFVAQLQIFLRNIKLLNNPAQFLVPRKLRHARRFVRERLAKFSFAEFADKIADGQGQGSAEAHATFLGRTRTLCMRHGAATEGWTDYQLLLISGLGPNVMAASTWLLHHILADKGRLATVRRQLDDFVARSGGDIDIAEVPEACPLLQATWYEVLRYHGGFTLGRFVREDTTLAGQYLLRKGTYALAPLRPHHFDRQIWGANVDDFVPERFLSADGGVDELQRRNLRVYGVFGTMCPGRYLAVHMAMLLSVRLLLAFDMTSADGEEYRVPAESKDNMAGLPTPAWEVKVRLRPRTDATHGTVRIRFKEKPLQVVPAI